AGYDHAPITETAPPATHTATRSPGFSTAPATIEGVPKIPAPMIRPTMIAVASPSDRTCAGPEGDCGDFSGVGITESEIASYGSCAGADPPGTLRAAGRKAAARRGRGLSAPPSGCAAARREARRR